MRDTLAGPQDVGPRCSSLDQCQCRVVDANDAIALAHTRIAVVYNEVGSNCPMVL